MERCPMGYQAGETVAGRYALRRVAGRGGMGEVWEAEDRVLGTVVALKVVLPERADDAAAFARVKREVLLARRVSHPNVCRLFDVGQDGETVFLTMELLEGETLGQRIRRLGALPVPEALEIVRQVGAALDAAHQAGVVHRDLKSDNVILVREEGAVRAVVTDFGLARAAAPERGAATLTGTGTVVGTPATMAPEQLEGEDVTGAADLYALGVVMFEMVTGRLPFTGATPISIAAKRLAGPAPAAGLYAPGLEARWEAAIARCLERAPRARFGSAAEIVAALEREAPPLPGATAPAPGAIAPARARPRTRLRAALGLGLLAAAGLGYGLWRAGSPARRPRSLAVLPFTNLRPDPATDFLGPSLAEAVGGRLARTTALEVRAGAQVARHRGPSLDLVAAGRELRADALVVGTFLRERELLRLAWQLADASDGHLLGSGSLEVPYARLATLPDLLADRVARELGTTPEASRPRRQPRSALAYELYLRGADLLVNGQARVAAGMLERSTELDPSYPPAWLALGSAYRVMTQELVGAGYYARANAAYETARRIAPDEPELFLHLADFYTETNRVEEAVPLLLRALAAEPRNPQVHWKLGYAYRYGGLLNESLTAARRALEIDPYLGGPVRSGEGTVLNALLYLGRAEEFLASLPARDNAYVNFYRGFALWHLSRRAEAVTAFERAYRLDPGNLFARLGRALSLLETEGAGRAGQVLAEVEAQVLSAGILDGEALYKVGQAWALAGESARAVRMLRKSVESGFFPWTYMLRDPLLAPLQGDPGLEAALAMARARYEEFRKRFGA